MVGIGLSTFPVWPFIPSKGPPAMIPTFRGCYSLSSRKTLPHPVVRVNGMSPPWVPDPHSSLYCWDMGIPSPHGPECISGAAWVSIFLGSIPLGAEFVAGVAQP